MVDQSSAATPVDPYVAYWRVRQARQAAHNQRLSEQAHRDALAIAAMLRQEFCVTRVILFGSLAKGRFLPDSDIDLAIEGAPAATFFSALAQANKLSEFPVDLKPLEVLEPHFKARILATGEEI